MLRVKPVLITITALFPLLSFAQKIFYSEPDRNDQKTLNYDVVGKMNDHYLVYKNYKTKNYVSIYDGEMKLVDNIDLDFVPDKIITSDVLGYKDHFYLIYQYQKRNIVYCMAANIDANGKIMGEPMELDTTSIGYFASNRIYNVINSEDKQQIMVFKINSKNSDNYILTTSLFGEDLKLKYKARSNVSMPERGDFLTEFSLDNDGDLACIRAFGSSENDNLKKITLITKTAGDDSVAYHEVAFGDIFLDDIKLKIDNANKHYLLTSFYSKVKRGSVDGLFCALWDKRSGNTVFNTQTVFSDEIRQEAKSSGNAKFAFDDFYIQNILMKRDGGFLIASESVYSSSRGTSNNRWDYLYGGSPFLSPSDYYYYSSPFYGSYYYPWWRWGGTGYQINRYYADNIAVVSFDSSANMQWTNVIHKSQYDDYTDDFLGYGTLTTGGQLHFLFNQLEKRTMLLSDQSIKADGTVNRSPTLRNLSKEYEFMPRYAKQVSSYEIIVPCQYRNYICFAKVEF